MTPEPLSDPTRIDGRFAVAGDWDGDVGWIRRVFACLAAQAPDVRTVIQLGDFFPGAWPLNDGSPDTSPTVAATNRAAAQAGVERVFVMLGNHAPWPWFRDLTRPQQVAERVWVLPRVHRFEAGGRRILSVDGAASVDEHHRLPGVNWWVYERVTDADVAAAVAGGHVDVLLTHDTVDGTPVQAVQRILASNPMGWKKDALQLSLAGRVRLRRILDETSAQWAIHGHMHVSGGGVTREGVRVTALSNERSPGNVIIVDPEPLTSETLFTALQHGAAL